MFFTNWHYHKQYHSALSIYSWKDCGDNWGNYQAQIKKKKCFVCNKKSHWLSRHTRKKCEDSKNKFKELFSQGFDKWASQYIIEYKKIDYKIDNDIEKIDKTVETKVLMIDIKFSNKKMLS